MTINRIIASIISALSLSSIVHAAPCTKTEFTSDAELFIFRGDRTEAKKVWRLIEYNGFVDLEWLKNANFEIFYTPPPKTILTYFRDEHSEWQTPSSIWSVDAIHFEISENGINCHAVIDRRQFYAQQSDGNGYLTRLLQAFERDRILAQPGEY